jgi:hypothetical protein
LCRCEGLPRVEQFGGDEPIAFVKVDGEPGEARWVLDIDEQVFRDAISR